VAITGQLIRTSFVERIVDDTHMNAAEATIMFIHDVSEVRRHFRAFSELVGN
jgi:hypothetical protein